MRTLFFLASTMAAGLAMAGAALADESEDALASVKNPTPPAFPEACKPAPDEDFSDQSVIVAYDVTRRGLPENVRVRESTDECFNDTAVAAVRGWTFEPRRVKGKAAAQPDMETTFRFRIDGETSLTNFDARPLKRVPPIYPNGCRAGRDGVQVVVLQFDVTEEGKTENIEVTESTNDCFNRSATRSVEKWEYRPQIVAGKPVARRGVVTQIRYVMASGYGDGLEPEEKMRSTLVRRLNRAGRISRKDPQKALEMLAEIEEKYGDSFTKAESAAFHQIRGFTRIGVEDVQGALDDLQIAKTRGTYISPEEREAINRAIAALEVYIAQQRLDEFRADGEEEIPDSEEPALVDDQAEASQKDDS